MRLVFNIPGTVSVYGLENYTVYAKYSSTLFSAQTSHMADSDAHCHGNSYMSRDK